MRLSGPSPFADCPPAGLDGVLPAGALEPAVAVSPLGPRHLAAVWTQDRFRGLVAGVSTDGGRSWSRTVVPATARCTGGAFDYVDDVWLSFGPTGVLHLSAHVFDAPATTPSGLITARSHDGGRTWTRPVTIVAEADPERGTFVGGAIAADPHRPGRVHAVVPKIVEPREQRRPFGGSVVFATSDDAGRSWRPRTTFDAGTDRLTTGHQLLVQGDGTLVNTFTLVDLSGDRPVRHAAVMRSRDHGGTWSEPILVAEMRSAGVTDPQSPRDPVASGSAMLTDAAVAPGGDRIHLVWQDARFSGGRADAIALSSSADGGRTWSEPVRVNRTPAGIPAGDQQAFNASVAVAADGTLAVDYFDLRHNDAAAGLRTDRWLVTCRPVPARNCASRSGSGTETRLTGRSFDMRRAPFLAEIGPPGFFLGDYTGLAATGGHGFVAAFAQPDETDPAAVTVVPIRR
ncbi:sialidase family protein [Spirillospora sp. NPDC029432]|uniref:sialidase family protein n=1 Tax=Spirillospora sp. NPDC029432 TaxID=3154599 RepID=UPI003456EAF9